MLLTESFLELVEGYLSRFDEELEQISIKQGIGGKNRRKQHCSRLDAITHTMKMEKSDFEGCGLELPDLLDSDNLAYLRKWDGELRYVQNIKIMRITRARLESAEEDQMMETA